MNKVSNLRAGSARQPQVVPASTEPQAVFVTDAEGRRLQLRELTIIEESDVIIAAGAHSDNPRTLNRALLAARVAAVSGADDDIPNGLPVPKTEEQYRQMMLLVGHAGIFAVAAHLASDDNDKSDDAKNAKN